MKRAVVILAALAACTAIAWQWIHRPVSEKTDVLILGHGGSGIRSHLPIDSQRSVQAAMQHPIDGVEIDVKMTRDSVLVAFHADKLESVSDCSGSVDGKNWDELNRCRQRGWFSKEPISTVDKILRPLIKRKGTIVSLDLKPDTESEPYLKTFTTQITRLIRSYPEIRFLVESNRPELLSSIAKMNERAETFIYCNDMNEGISICQRNGLTGVTIDMKYIQNKELIIHARSQQVKTMLWGCGSVFSNRKALELKPNLIQTDHIRSIVNIRD